MVNSMASLCCCRWPGTQRQNSWCSLCVTDGQEPHGRLPGPVCVAAEVQKPHGRLPGPVAVDGQEPSGRLPGRVCVLQMSSNPMADCLASLCVTDVQETHGPVCSCRWPGIPWRTPWFNLQSVLLRMARNPMVDSVVQSVLLQMGRNPLADSLAQSLLLQMTRNP